MMSADHRSSKSRNQDLLSFYENAYSQKEENVFTFFENGKKISEDVDVICLMLSGCGGSLLDVGCGTGLLLEKLATSPAWKKLKGIDYSPTAVNQALQRLGKSSSHVDVVVEDILQVGTAEQFDVVTCLGTLEHCDNPQQVLEKIKLLLKPSGIALIAVPHFVNIRGYVWMTLHTLFEIPMSLSDLHFIHPWQMRSWCDEVGLNSTLEVTVDYDKANGLPLLTDFQKRIPNALRDAGFGSQKIPEFLEYIRCVTMYAQEETGIRMQGATAIYRCTQR